MLKQRIITAFILLFLLLAALFILPVSAWSALVGLVVLLGAREWTTLSKMRKFEARLYMIATLILCFSMIWMQLFLPPDQKMILQFLVYGTSVLFWVLVVPLWLAGRWSTSGKWLLSFIGWVVLLPMGMAMLDLRSEIQQPWWLLGAMGLVWMADICAYFTGRALGKHKLAPGISPGKTWEGVAGATLGVLVYIAIVMFNTGLMQRYSLILFALIGVAFSVMGDLFESAIKRQAGVKDSGKLLPGHGGLLDRIDALTSTLPLAALVLILTGLA